MRDPWLTHVQVTEALMVLKWGGSLTDVGLEQASLLGTRFRGELFPGTQIVCCLVLVYALAVRLTMSGGVEEVV